MYRKREANKSYYAIDLDRPPEIGAQIEIVINSRIRQMVLIGIEEYHVANKLNYKLNWAFKCPSCKCDYTIQTSLKQKTVKLHCLECIQHVKDVARAKKLARVAEYLGNAATI